MRLFVLLCVFLLPFANAFKEYIDEYSRNIYDDDEEYSLNNEAPEVPNGREHYIRKIRSIEEDYRNIERIDLEEYFGEGSRDQEEHTRNKRELTQENNIEKLGNPLEIIVLDVQNDTKSDEIQTNDLKINDFIRFKRDVDLKSESEKSRPKRDKENNSQDSRTIIGPNNQDYQKQEDKSTIRAPRVHFVTQRRSESSSSPVFQNYERRNDYPSARNYERYPRHYDGPSSYRRNYYDAPYFEPERTYYNPGNKQRRIIYYATLPEDFRRPRDRYNYRDTYRDDRYLNRDDMYRYRKPYVPPKSRYDDLRDLRFNKTPYPEKVSADVNVREVKKNPERRIYSVVDRRYDFDTPQYELPEDPYRIGNK